MRGDPKGGNRPPLAGRRGSRGDHSEGPPLRAFGFFPRARKETPRRRGGLREGRQSYPPAGTAPAEAEYSSFYPRNLSVSFAESFPRGKPIRAAGKTFAAAGNGELRQDTDQHPEKPFNIACSAVRDGRLTSRTRLFSAAPMPPLLQRPPHRGAGAEPRRALSPVSLASEKPGRRRQSATGKQPHSTASVPHLPLISPPPCVSRRRPASPRGSQTAAAGGTEALPLELLVVTLPTSPASVRRRRGGCRTLETVNCTDQHPEKPLRFACSTVSDGRLASRTRLFSAAPMPPSLQRPPHRGAGAEPRRALSPVSLASEKPGRRRQSDENTGRNE